MMKCRFCDIIQGSYQYGDIDKPFYENDNFFAMASIGSLIEGWSLIVPKAHQLSMRKVYQEETFKEIVNGILPTMIKKYGSIIAFEHGSNKEGSITACGTDHAHLHLVPFKQSLVNKLHQSGLVWNKCASSDIHKNTIMKEYLFYTELGISSQWEDPIGYLHILEQPISQYFRHLISETIGKKAESDYRKYPFLENAEKTKFALQQLTA